MKDQVWVFIFVEIKYNLIINYKKLLIANIDKILVEEYIPGKEIQVAVMGNKALGRDRTYSLKEKILRLQS